jgi:Cu-Zn family superoxide dismutase
MVIIKLISIFLTLGIAISKKARCSMVPDNESGISGYVTFIQHSAEDPVTVEVMVYGTTQVHGFHIHEKGSIEGGCLAAGAHYNPFGKNHGAPNATERHVGDLGNIISEHNSVQYTFTDKTISLFSDNHIIGRTCVVHEREDDLGLGGNAESLKTGNAGGRIACGVVQEYDSYAGLYVGIGIIVVAIVVGVYFFCLRKRNEYERIDGRIN